MSCTRPLAVAFVLVVVSGCGPASTSLLGQPLVGSIGSRIDGTEGDSVYFPFDGLGFDVDDCPFLDAGAVTFDGVANDDVIDGYVPASLLSGPRCFGLALSFDLDSPDVARDAELVVDSGVDGDVVRYEGAGLQANRRLELVGSARVTTGGSLRVRYTVPADGTGPVTASTDGSELPVTDLDDVIDILIPAYVPAGPQEVRVEVPYTVTTLTCEGFASCDVTGKVVQKFAITVDAD